MNSTAHRGPLAALLLAILIALAPAALAGPPAAESIVGGQEATPGEWPWQVALVGKGTDLYMEQFCGGSLIHRNWVLTAALCVSENSPASIDVVAGIHDLDDPEPNFKRSAVTQIVVYPAWNEVTKENDVALLKLATPIDERPAVGGALPIAHIPLVAKDVGPLTGVNGTVTGWGNTLGQPNPGGANYPDRLHEVVVPIVSNETCNTPASYEGYITANMLCAGFQQGGKDTCEGDQGGPLAVNAGGEWKLAGISSRVFPPCGATNFYGIYARVSNFVSWITAIVDPVQASHFAYAPLVVRQSGSQVKLFAVAQQTDHRAFVPLITGGPGGLVNGAFELGPGVGWSESSTNGYGLIVNDLGGNPPLLAHSGAWAVWLGGAVDETSILSQQVAVPAGQPYLRYYYVIGSQETTCGSDIARVSVNEVVVRSYALCQFNDTQTWVVEVLDLSDYAGQSVLLKFLADLDDDVLNSNLFIDDVSFLASPAAIKHPSSGAAGQRR